MANKEDLIQHYEDVIRGYSFGAPLEEAIEYLKANAPENEVLKKAIYANDGTEFTNKEINENFALARLNTLKNNGAFDFAEFKEGLNILESSSVDYFKHSAEVLRAYADGFAVNYVAYEEIDSDLDDEKVEENLKSINEVIDDIADEVADGDSEEAMALRNITVEDENGNTLTGDEEKNVKDALIESAKQATVLNLVHSYRYTTAADRSALLRKEFEENLGKSIILTSASDIVGPRQEDESAEAYLYRYNQALKKLNEEQYQSKIKSLSSDENNIVVRNNTAAALTGMTASRLLDRAGYYAYKGKEKLSNLFKTQAIKFNKKARALLGNTVCDFAVQLWRNKTQIAAMGALSFGAIALTGTISLPAAVAVGVAYAGLSKAASWAFPLWGRRKEILKNAPKDADTSELKGFKNFYGLFAVRDAMSQEERAAFRDSQKKAWLMSGIAGASMTVGAFLTDYGIVNNARTAAAIGSATRIGSINVVQGYWIKKTYDELQKAKEQLEENQNNEKLAEKVAKLEKSLKTQAIGLGLTDVAAVVTVFNQVSGIHAAPENTADTSSVEAHADQVADTGNAATNETTAPETTEQPAAEAAAPTAEISEAQQYFENYDVPTEYSPDLGITKSEWNFLQNNIAGVYATTQGAEHFGLENAADSQTIFDNAVRNVATYMHEHADQFQGQEPLKVLHDVLRRHALSVEAHPDGDGHLIAVFKANEGGWSYGDPSLNQPMNAWWKIICNGYNTEIPEGTNLNSPLERLAQDLSFAAKHGNGNRMIGWMCEQTAFAKGVAHHHIPTPAAPRVEPPAPEQPAVVNNTVTETRVPQPEINGKVNITETPINEAKPDQIVSHASVNGTGNEFTDVNDGTAHHENGNSVDTRVRTAEGDIPLRQYINERSR